VTDVAVFRATAAGVAAAVAAAETGAHVVLVEPGTHVGGMVSGGLSWTDVGDERVLGGFARRFYAAVAEHYGAALWGVKGPEPHVAEQLLLALLGAVDVRLGETELPDAAVYVDASYEGDLLPRFGVPFAVGRERATSTASGGPGGSRRTGRRSTTSTSCCRRSATTALCCRTCARPSSTTRAGPMSRSARATAACRRTPIASA
jgi:FAD-dependent oxidoreductase family protein